MNITVLFNEVQSLLFVANDTFSGNLTDQRSVFIKFPYLHLAFQKRRVVIIQSVDSGSHITGSIKVICFSINYNKLALILVSGSIIPLPIPESGTVSRYLPCTFCHALLVKLVCDTPDRVSAGYGRTVFFEIIPLIIKRCPSNRQFAELGAIPLPVEVEESGVFSAALAVFTEVVIDAVHGVNAGDLFAVDVVCIVMPSVGNHDAVHVLSAVRSHTAEQFTARALEDAVGQDKRMSGCRGFGTEVNNRMAHVAVGSAGVTRFRAGCRFVGKGGDGMGVSAVPRCLVRFSFFGLNHELSNCPCLGVTVNFFSGKGFGLTVCQSDLPLLDADFHSNPPVFITVFKPLVRILISLFENLVASADLAADVVELPHAHRNGKQRTFTGCAYRPRSFDRQGENLVGSVISIGYRKAVRDDHVIEDPLVHAVEVENGADLLNACDISSNNVHIIERTEENAVKRCVLRNHFDQSAVTGRDVYLADHGRVITLFVADRELDRVQTGTQNDAAVHGDNAVFVGTGDLVSVHIRFCRSGVDSGRVGLLHIVGNHRCKVHFIPGDVCTVRQHLRVRHVIRRIRHIRENRRLAVVDRRGIVKGDLIHINREVAGDVRMLLGKIFVRRAVTVGNVELHEVVTVIPDKTLVFAEVTAQIVPARFGKGVDNSGTAGTAVQRVARDRRFRGNIRAVLVHVGDGEQHPAHPETHILVGNINPRADRLHTGIISCIVLTGSGTVQSGHLIAGFPVVGIIDVDAERVITAVHLAVFPRRDKGAALRKIIVILGISGLKAARRSVFKIENDLRALAECHPGGRGHSGGKEGRTYGGPGNAGRFRTGSEFHSVEGSGIHIRKFKEEVRFTCHNLVNAVFCNHRKFHGFSVRNGNGFRRKTQGFRNHRMQSHAADGFSVIFCRDHNIAGCRRGQFAVLVCTVDDTVGQPFGNFCGVSGGADADGADGNGGSRGQIFVFRRERHVIKGFGCDRGRDDKQTAGDAALRTVGRFVDDDKRILTLRLTSVGHRAAAVEVSRPFTAEVKHDLCLLHEGQTDRFRLLVSVRREDDHLVVLGDTDGLAGIFLGILLIGIGKHDVSVIHQHFVDSERFLNVPLIGFILGGVADLHGAVLEDRKVGGFLIAGHIVAVHNKHAGGLTCRHIVVGGIDADDDGAVIVRVACRRFFIESGDLFGQFGHAVRRVVHVFVGGEKSHRVHRHVDGCREHFYLFTVFVVNGINVLGDTACQGGLSVLHHRKPCI